MARESFGGMGGEPLQIARDEMAYDAGYDRTMREFQWARRHGWSPSQRRLVVAFMHAMRVYTTARGGKPVGGQRPDWLRGRADALRDLLREGAGRLPTETPGDMPPGMSDGL